ncbi:hypothetical protein BDW74DRAFT_186962 [Aspergillus multicolor]|uniref:NAD(P)/FAD-dependent oxidoreductase n=1 Tax=Aspergillus multicolor TaxID=41759 RepID=UPI003CCCCB66
MDIPETCTVLIIGGGPGGSYAASVLAREGIETVLLEAETSPSLLVSTRKFLRFVDVLDMFEEHGFRHKVDTDFLPYGGHAWKVLRSEADELLFQHAKSCGAAVLDGTRFPSEKRDIPTTLPFPNGPAEPTSETTELRRPVSASWIRTRKDKTKTTGTITFKYLIDASGCAGLLSTKYLKSRRFNPGLRNVAVWGYFEGAADYGVDTPRFGGPLFDRVQAQDIFTARKAGQSSRSFLMTSLSQTPELLCLLKDATLVSNMDGTAGTWYSTKVKEAYMRFLLVVSGAYAQIRGKEMPVLKEEFGEGFERAFGLSRPIIQGAIEAAGGTEPTSDEVSQSIDFCIQVIRKAQTTGALTGPCPVPNTKDELEEQMHAVRFGAGCRTSGLMLWRAGL